MDDAWLLDSIVSDVATAAAILTASPDADVAHCPGWKVTDLVGHHGGVLRCAEAIIRTGEPVVEQFSAPGRLDRRRNWYIDAAKEFVATASRTDRDRACWTFGRPPSRVWFWSRRQALEAAVHRWDGEFGAGAVSDLDVGLACLGVTEVVEDLFPRQVALGRTADLSCCVQLLATDVDQRWILGSRAGTTGAVIEAPASVLVLLLWQRVRFDDPRIRLIGSEAVQEELESARFAP